MIASSTAVVEQGGTGEQAICLGLSSSSPPLYNNKREKRSQQQMVPLQPPSTRHSEPIFPIEKTGRGRCLDGGGIAIVRFIELDYCIRILQRFFDETCIDFVISIDRYSFESQGERERLKYFFFQKRGECNQLVARIGAPNVQRKKALVTHWIEQLHPPLCLAPYNMIDRSKQQKVIFLCIHFGDLYSRPGSLVVHCNPARPLKKKAYTFLNWGER